MKSILFTVSLILLLSYSHAFDSSYKVVSHEDFSNSTLYQDLFRIGFDSTVQKATNGGRNNTLPELYFDYNDNQATLAVKNKSGILYLQGKVTRAEGLIFTFTVHYKRSTGQIGVTNMSWYSPPGAARSTFNCSVCSTVIPIPSASDAAFSYAFNSTISQAIIDQKLPNTTYQLGQIFSAYLGGSYVNYDYTYTVVGGPNNYTYRIESVVGTPLLSVGSDEQLLSVISLYDYDVQPI